MKEEKTSLKDIEVIRDDDFSFDGFQVVRGEFFSHIYEPSITFNNNKISLNAACIRKLPEVEYVQMLVNPEERRIAVKPCREDEKDSFKWRSGNGTKLKPKQITCKIFFAKVMDLMEWDPKYRYKILRKLIRTKEESIFVFDLTSAEAYQNRAKGTSGSAQAPLYPADWKNQFGIPATEHQDIQQISIFDDYTVFKIERSEENHTRKEAERNVDKSNESSCDNTGSEETTDQDTQ